MHARIHPIAQLALTLAVLAAAGARADEIETLRAENARLEKRVEELERENARLRGEVRAAEPPTPTHVVERETESGQTVWTTEPGRVEAAGRSVHLIWLERTPGQAGATLWLRGEFSGGIYRQVDHLELRLDGAEHSLPITDYSATRITAGIGHRPQRRDHETLRIDLAPPLLAALGEASTLSGRLGRTSFTVPTDVLASLRALARKSV